MRCTPNRHSRTKIRVIPITPLDWRRLKTRVRCSQSPVPPEGADLSFAPAVASELNFSFGINMTYAGTKLMESRNASSTPRLTKIPKTCTGGMGTSDSDAKPTAVVNEVYSMGVNSSRIT